MTSSLRILEQMAFLAIDDQQSAHLRSAGTVRDVNPGDVLVEVGASAYGLVVVLAGSTDVVDRVDDNHSVRTIDPGGFDGELGLLTGERTLTACVVHSRGRVVIVPPAALREIIAAEAELGNLLVTAFAARRRLLILSGVGPLSLIGPSEDPEVLRLLEFADRNRIPYRWLDPHNPHDTQSVATCGTPEGGCIQSCS